MAWFICLSIPLTNASHFQTTNARTIARARTHTHTHIQLLQRSPQDQAVVRRELGHPVHFFVKKAICKCVYLRVCVRGCGHASRHACSRSTDDMHARVQPHARPHTYSLSLSLSLSPSLCLSVSLSVSVSVSLTHAHTRTLFPRWKICSTSPRSEHTRWQQTLSNKPYDTILTFTLKKQTCSSRSRRELWTLNGIGGGDTHRHTQRRRHCTHFHQTTHLYIFRLPRPITAAESRSEDFQKSVPGTFSR